MVISMKWKFAVKSKTKAPNSGVAKAFLAHPEDQNEEVKGIIWEKLQENEENEGNVIYYLGHLETLEWDAGYGPGSPHEDNTGTIFLN